MLIEPGEDGKLGGRQAGDVTGEDRDMPLMGATQVEADLLGELVGTGAVSFLGHIEFIDSLVMLPQHLLVYQQSSGMVALAGSYWRPDTLDAALDLLASQDVVVAAGCTDLFPATERKILPGDVLDITGIEALSGINLRDDVLRLGAITTWTDILQSDLPPACDGLKLAAREVGAKQIQHRGTIAGNLCNASPAADGVPPLLTLDAEVELQSTDGSRRLPLADFLEGPRRTGRASNELLTAVLIPKKSLVGSSHFLKLGARSYLVISIVMTAARIVVKDGIVADAALAIGACGPVATRLPEIERSIIGHALDPAAISDEAVARTLSPITDIRADAGYRTSSAAELLRRTLQALTPAAKEAA